MIRSSALLTAVAMAVLVAGVSAANLGLIYLSIAVSILAAVTLAVGVLLRRRELFGEAEATPRSTQPGWAAAETAKAGPVPVRPAADDRVTADRGGRREDTRRNGEQHGDVAARPRKPGSGAAGTGSARWPGSRAAKGAPATAGEHSAGPGRAARSPSGGAPAAHAPGAREPARGDRAGRERGDREPAGREPVARETFGREPVPTGGAEGGAGWATRPGRGAGPGRPAKPGRDRTGAGRDRDSGQDQDPAAARPDREHAGRRRDRGGERDRAAAARADRARTASGQHRAREAAARSDRERAGRERDDATAGQQAAAFGLPPPSERTRARAEELGRTISGDPGRDDFWERVSEELTDGGSQDPVRPAWPATAGPRAMGTGPAPPDRDESPRPPDEGDGRDGQPAGAGAEPRWDRVVPPYVDDPAERGRQQREPERQPVGADESGDGAARAGATAEALAGSAWSAWSGARTKDQGADAGKAGGDSTEHDPTHDERVSMQATAGAAADIETDAAGETGDDQAEAGIQGDDAAVAAGANETAGRAEPGGAAEASPVGAAPSGAERSARADDPGETAVPAAAAEGTAVPGSTRGATDTGKAADAGPADAGGAAGAGADGSAPVDDKVTVVPGVPRYHRRGCILIRFLSDGDLETMTRREAEAAGWVPCKACQPDQPAAAG